MTADRQLVAAPLLAFCPLAQVQSHAANHPSRPIRIVVPGLAPE
jgi:tripartite-type tricarboxylate transporter receptor subunit TctC